MAQHPFSKGIADNSPTAETDEWSVAYDFLSGMMAETLVVLDFCGKNFQYMPRYGYKQDTSIALGYDFLKKMIHPEDMYFGENIHTIILDSLNSDELQVNQVNYFSFLLQIKSTLLFNGKCDYLMTYIKLKPRWVNGLLRYGICMLSPSIIRKQKNQLCVHYKNMDYADYSFKTKKWEYHKYSPLSDRQKEVLIWAQQGLSLKETANKMNISDKTIENIRGILFEKFGVNTIEQAILFAFNRRLIFHSPPARPIPEAKAIRQKKQKE